MALYDFGVTACWSVSFQVGLKLWGPKGKRRDKNQCNK